MYPARQVGGFHEDSEEAGRPVPEQNREIDLERLVEFYEPLSHEDLLWWIKHRRFADPSSCRTDATPSPIRTQSQPWFRSLK